MLYFRRSSVTAARGRPADGWPERMSSSKRTILFVDDEPNVLNGLRRGLADHEGRWAMLFAGGGAEALAVLAGQAVDVVVSDQRMPGMSGLELMREFQVRAPGTIRILLTGNTDQATAAAAINQGMVFRFFTKPCPVPVLVAGIDEAIGERAAQEAAERANAEALARNNAMLRQLVGDLTEANRELERFTFVAAHDLREPLRQITSYIQLLQRRYADGIDGEAADYFRFVVEGVRRMDALTGALSAYTQVIGPDSEPAEMDMGRACAAALERLRDPIARSGARIRVEEPLGPVFGDQRAVITLWRHLIDNAVKFVPPGAIPEVRISAATGDGGRVFSVADNGIGVEATGHDIFEMFRRLHGRDQYHGLGIGLAACRRIVRHHGGRIWHEPNSPRGTVFRFTLAGAAP